MLSESEVIMILVNGKEIKGKEFAYEGSHKIYIIEDDADRMKAMDRDYSIHSINELQEIYDNSCELRFIYNWKLSEVYAKQFENAVFKEREVVND